MCVTEELSNNSMFETINENLNALSPKRGAIRVRNVSKNESLLVILLSNLQLFSEEVNTTVRVGDVLDQVEVQIVAFLSV
jgi:hypothetical protein